MQVRSLRRSSLFGVFLLATPAKGRVGVNGSRSTSRKGEWSLSLSFPLLMFSVFFFLSCHCHEKSVEHMFVDIVGFIVRNDNSIVVMTLPWSIFYLRKVIAKDTDIN